MTRAEGEGTLTYNLYADAGRTQVFGDGTGGSVTVHVSANNTHVQAIWARILGGQQRVLAGRYTDSVVATISY
jgi:spore coat protein U-like protein